MESETTRSFSRRVVQDFLDIIILRQLRGNHSVSGYDVIRNLYKKLHVLPSPGTVYSILYSLERRNLVQGRVNNGKRVYEITNQGEKLFTDILLAKANIQSFFSYLLSEV